MKTFVCCLSILASAVFPAHGDLYSYPIDKKPAVSLAQACSIAETLLKTRGDGKKYYITRVSLYGSKEQDGWGAWNLFHFDEKGNKINVYIPFPTGDVGLHYYPHDYSTNGGGEEIDFEKTAAQILAEQDGGRDPDTAPKTKSEDRK